MYTWTRGHLEIERIQIFNVRDALNANARCGEFEGEIGPLFLSLRAQSDIVETDEPDIPEPDDLEDFLFSMQNPFRRSITQNLVSTHNLHSKKDEGLEQMFASFNLIARQLGREYPPTLTEN